VKLVPPIGFIQTASSQIRNFLLAFGSPEQKNIICILFAAAEGLKIIPYRLRAVQAQC
jgi:hypothetical protein